MTRSLALALLCSPAAQAAEWWVPLPADRGPLHAALDDLWDAEPHTVVVGPAWSREIEVVWVAGHVNRFDGGELVARSPAPTARTAVALARSWFTEDHQREQWLPLGMSAFDFDFAEPATRPIVEEVATKPRPGLKSDVRFGPTLELRQSLGSGLRASFHDPIGGEVELVGWLQPALTSRFRRSETGSWIAVELRAAALLDFFPGDPELRVGPTVMLGDFGGGWRAPGEQDKALGGVWSGVRARLMIPFGDIGLGSDLAYQVPVATLNPIDQPLVGALSRYPSASGVITLPLGRGDLAIDIGGIWQLEPEAESALAGTSPFRTRIAWMIRP